ncbi:MAG: helix-turn-helix domain-containing protein [Saprospiraceae bacterium]|nr:helix-turn-helix domain-containing protein [Saprospiraceae bacterium]
MILSTAERTTLENGYKHHPKHHFRQRCQAMLLSDSGEPIPKIAELFKVRTRTIYTWMDRWTSSGIVGLMILPGGGVKSKLRINDSNLVELVKKKRRNMPVV